MLKIGEKVIFHEKVYHEPYSPYYDKYMFHVFVIESKEECNLYSLKCIDGDINVDGTVFEDCLVSLEKPLKALNQAIATTDDLALNLQKEFDIPDKNITEFKQLYKEIMQSKINSILVLCKEKQNFS